MSDQGKICKASVLHTCLTCADIPGVQKHITMLLPMLEEVFDQNLEDTLDATLLDIEDFTSEESSEEDWVFFLAALWLSTLNDLGTADPAVTRAAKVSGKALVQGGARRAGAPLPKGLPGELSAPSSGDLMFWFRRAASSDPSIAALFKDSVRDFLKGTRDTVSRLALIRNLREILMKARKALAVMLDLWAYRWNGIGAFEGLSAGAETREIRIIAFNNPPNGPDARTTAFCRWVHGKTIEIRRARLQIQAYLGAVEAGDEDAAKAAWPILDSSDARGDGADFEVSFRGLALPPYHFFCRTVPVVAPQEAPA